MDTEIFRDLLDRHTRLTAPRDAHDVITELSRIGLRHDAILPGQPSGLARSDVTYSCSSPARAGVFVALGAAILAGGGVTWMNWLIQLGEQL
ncbi:DUF6112 family protein [Homoserinimonas aerilata]|uniref:DUF6112 family protein n=1 Tax=Homoserinimonas aerilata TaxID=1162970 RepID=UPI001151BDE8|nr:DUF6112 family protein [Homoserinimonas aerilata]